MSAALLQLHCVKALVLQTFDLSFRCSTINSESANRSTCGNHASDVTMFPPQAAQVARLPKRGPHVFEFSRQRSPDLRDRAGLARPGHGRGIGHRPRH